MYHSLLQTCTWKLTVFLQSHDHKHFGPTALTHEDLTAPTFQELIALPGITAKALLITLHLPSASCMQVCPRGWGQSSRLSQACVNYKEQTDKLSYSESPGKG